MPRDKEVTERTAQEVSQFLKLFRDDKNALSQLKLLCGYDAQIFTTDPYRNAYRLGRRSVIVDVIAMLKIS